MCLSVVCRPSNMPPCLIRQPIVLCHKHEGVPASRSPHHVSFTGFFAVAQTENGYLLVYDVHVTKQPAIPALRSQSWGTHDSLQQLHAVDVYVKHPVRCEREVPATCVCCDSRTILVAYADGYWGSCSWFGKVRCCWLTLDCTTPLSADACGSITRSCFSIQPRRAGGLQHSVKLLTAQATDKASAAGSNCVLLPDRHPARR